MGRCWLRAHGPIALNSWSAASLRLVSEGLPTHVHSPCGVVLRLRLVAAQA